RRQGTLGSACSCPRASGGPSRQEDSLNLSLPGRTLEFKSLQSWWAAPASGGHREGGSAGGTEEASKRGRWVLSQLLPNSGKSGFLS
ncbi:unnamed protein product, partial [Gulo gulo]